MRAVVLKRYGPPEVLRLDDYPRPEIGPRDVLIRTHAAAINPIDWRIRSGSLRFVLPLRLPLVLGYDVSGVVEAVGSQISSLRVGEEVFSFLDRVSGGGYAEYAVASESVVVPKPQNLSHVEAAALPLAASTALQCLRDFGRLAPGQSVLINGASGGVGSYAVQLAKAMGAEVTGVCSTRNIELVRSLGADHVIDYTAQDFTRQDRQYDVVLDAVAKSSFWACRGILKPRGRFVTDMPTPPNYLAHGLTALLGGRQARAMLARPRGDDLRILKRLAEEGKLRPLVDRVFPLDEAAEAHQTSQAGHVRGKLVLQVVGG
jgi:NADPH:quinone reductase-like Zn-dependent oxidoreductase